MTASVPAHGSTGRREPWNGPRGRPEPSPVKRAHHQVSEFRHRNTHAPPRGTPISKVISPGHADLRPPSSCAVSEHGMRAAVGPVSILRLQRSTCSRQRGRGGKSGAGFPTPPPIDLPLGDQFPVPAPAPRAAPVSGADASLRRSPPRSTTVRSKVGVCCALLLERFEECRGVGVASHGRRES